MPSLLVTNDFPPKVGGIQSYLYELWRRLPAHDTTVLTIDHAGARGWDAEQPFAIERVRAPVLLPVPSVRARIDELVRSTGASVVLLDPMLPLGLVGRRLRSVPHVVVAHGAEIMVPGRLPGTNIAARSVLRAADAIVAAGHYPARVATAVAGYSLRGVQIPPGVDAKRFRPLDDAGRAEARKALGLSVDRPLVVGVSRLVPRKGFDTLIGTVARLDDSVQLAIAGAGRDLNRLESVARRRGVSERVRFLGRVPDADLPRLYACADVFAMLCRERWMGLEAEGFGIVFLEAAACGVPAVAGRSGGSHEAVAHGHTGFVVDPHSEAEAASAIERFVGDTELRHRMGEQARRRATNEFSYDVLVDRLRPLCRGDLGAIGTLVSEAR